MAKRKVYKTDSDRLINDLADTLSHWDGESLAEKAEEILGHSVKYLGDGFFEIKES